MSAYAVMLFVFTSAFLHIRSCSSFPTFLLVQVKCWDLRIWCSAYLNLFMPCWKTTNLRARWRRLCQSWSITSSFICRSQRSRWVRLSCVGSKWDDFFHISNLNLASFNLELLPIILVLRFLIKSPSLSFLWASFKYWKVTINSPWSLLFCRLKNPNSLSLSS